jgi:hypothetical protein
VSGPPPILLDMPYKERTREQEFQASLVGRTVEKVRFDERTGLVVIRCSATDDEDAFFCFDAESFADAASIWPDLP